MAEIDDELRRILEGAGKDIAKIREALTGTSKALIKNTDTQKKQQKVVQELIKRNEKLRDHLKQNNALTEEQNETIDDNIKVIKKHSEETKRASKGTVTFTGILKKVGEFFLKTAMAVVNTGIEFAKTSNHIRTFQDAFDAGLEDIPGIGPILKKFGKELDDQTQMFKGLAQSGATFGSSIVTMGQAAYTSGLPLVQFQELIQDNTSTLARLFGTVNAGVPQIAGLTRELKRLTMTELSGFGLTMEEVNGFLGTFIELERARGRAGQMDMMTLAARTKDYAKNLTTLSRLTGESVQELDKRNRALAADGVFQAKLAQMSEEQQQRVIAALKLLPESAQQAAKEFIGLGVPVGDLGKGLSVFSGGRFEEALLGFTRRTSKFTEAELLRLDGAFKEIGTTGIQGGDAIASAALVGNNIASEFLQTTVQMAGVQADEAEFAKNSAAALDDINASTRALVSLPDQFGLMQAELQRVNINLMKGLVLDAQSLGGDALANFVDGNVDMTKAMADQLNEFANGVLGITKGPVVDQIDMSENDGFGPQAFHGTPGFQEFGTGTRATLHGSEMVLPERNVGELAEQLASAIASMATGVTNNNTTNTTGGASITNNNGTTIDMTTLNANTTELIDLNRKVAGHLNTLITIGAMTEKNTKNFNNNLANMSGSLV